MKISMSSQKEDFIHQDMTLHAFPVSEAAGARRP